MKPQHPLPMAQDARESADPLPQRPSWRFWSMLSLLLVVFTAGGYAWLGNVQGWGVGAQSVGEAPPHSMEREQFSAMVQRLAQRLEAQPDDADGWAMLGRSYAVMGMPEPSVQAYRRLVKLRPDNAQAHADLADALASQQQGQFEGEPARVVERALSLDARNAKAQALAGTAAFNRGDTGAAERHWQAALEAAEPGSRMAAQLRDALDEVRRTSTRPSTP